MESFISKYPNALNKEQCEAFINAFESCSTNGATIQSHELYGDQKNIRSDEVVMFDDHVPQLSSNMHVMLKPLVVDYCKTWPGAMDLRSMSTACKVQKTVPGGGYHVFHAENTGWQYVTRTLVWLVYLNDNFTGGETEFLNQSLRVVPEQGTVVIWPAAWPWQHRGNPPLTGDKYIATGWWHTYPNAG